MIFFGNLLVGIGSALHLIIILFMWLFIIRAILSWFSPDPRNPLVQYLYSATEPVLYWVRKRVPPIGMIDISVILVIAAIVVIDSAIAGTLVSYGQALSRSAVPVVGY